MRALPNDDRPCGMCGQACRVRLEGLFDDRFGAPGAYAILQCTDCGQEQTWPRPAEPELKALYERFYNAGVEPDSFYRGLRERFFASGLYRLWLSWDGDLGFHGRRGAGRLLDVGCNEGRGLGLYAGNGFQVEGLELNEAAAAVARRRGFRVRIQWPHRIFCRTHANETGGDAAGRRCDCASRWPRPICHCRARPDAITGAGLHDVIAFDAHRPARQISPRRVHASSGAWPQSARRRRRPSRPRGNRRHRARSRRAAAAGHYDDSRPAAGRHRLHAAAADRRRRGAGDVPRPGPAGAEARGLRARRQRHARAADRAHVGRSRHGARSGRHRPRRRRQPARGARARPRLVRA